MNILNKYMRPMLTYAGKTRADNTQTKNTALDRYETLMKHYGILTGEN